MDEILTLFAGGGDDEPEWHDKALCAQTDPEAFFPEKGGSTREAKRICESCDHGGDDGPLEFPVCAEVPSARLVCVMISRVHMTCTPSSITSTNRWSTR